MPFPSLPSRLLVLLVPCFLASQAVRAQTAPGTPAVDTAMLARLAVAAPVNLAPGGRPLSQTTWCLATGLAPVAQSQRISVVTYGRDIRLRSQLGPCSVQMPLIP